MQFIKKHPLFTLSTTLLLLLTCYIIFAIYVPDYLTVGESPKDADVIILLNGDIERVDKAVELYNEGYADKILLTNSTMDPISPKDLINRGIPESSIIEEKQAQSTYENAIFTKEMLENENITSALIVSSNYHMRRAKFSFDQVYSQSSINLTFVATNESYDPDYWLLTEKSTNVTYKETSKLAYYYIRYGIL